MAYDEQRGWELVNDPTSMRIVLVPAGDMAAPVPGSEKFVAECGHEVWIAPATKGYLQLGAATACVHCMTDELKRERP